MSRGKVRQPKNLTKKLKEVRLKLVLTQEEMTNALKLQGAKIHKGYVSLYEIGERLPPLWVVLAYAKLANVWCDYLIDDELDLPAKLPAKHK
jgi:transcriptional regulator with XRE-family HTH domain